MTRRTIHLSLIVVACIAAVILAGCTGPAANPPSTPVPAPPPTKVPVPAGPSSFDQANNGETYTISLDATIQLRLPENPSTGYSWNLLVTPGISILSETYIPDEVSGNPVGSGGTHLWFLKAVQPGEQVISGVYRRPWEPPAANGTVFRLTLIVNENTCSENVCTLPSLPPSVPLGQLPATTTVTTAGGGADVRSCTTNADCVPEQCCHPTSCVNGAYKGVCNELCTNVCSGPLDCGAGHCGCINGRCSVAPGQASATL